MRQPRAHAPEFSAFLQQSRRKTSYRAQKRGGASACSECGLASNHGEGVLQAHDKSDGPGKLLVNVEEWRGLLRLGDEGDARPEIETRSVCHGGAVRHGGAEEIASSAVCRKVRPLSFCSPGTPWGPASGPQSPSQRKSLARTLLRSPLMVWLRHIMCTGGDLHAHPAPFDGVGPRLVVDRGCQQRESKLVRARTEGLSRLSQKTFLHQKTVRNAITLVGKMLEPAMLINAY